MLNRKRGLDTHICDSKWKVIEETVGCILRKEQSRYSFQYIHHALFQLHHANYDNNLYENIKELLKAEVVSILGRLHRSAQAIEYLSIVTHEWHEFNDALSRITSVLLYIVKNPPPGRQVSFQELGATLFSDLVLSEPQVAVRIIEAVKRGASAHGGWNSILLFSVELQKINRGLFFQKLVEIPYVSAMCDYLKQESVKHQSSSVRKYVSWVKRVYEEENKKAEQLFHGMSLRVSRALHQALVKENRDFIQKSASGCVEMLQKLEITALKEVVDLYKQMDDPDVLGFIRSELGKRAQEIVGDSGTKLTVNSIELILKLLESAKRLRKECCLSNGSEVDDITKMVRENINCNNTLARAVLSHFSTKIVPAIRNNTLEKLCDDTLELYLIIDDKDMFEVAFQEHLSSRILHGNGELIKAEMFFLQRMKIFGGAAATSRLEKMIEDVTSSSDLNNRFLRELTNRREKIPIDFHVSVLTSGFWPQYVDVPVAFPASVEKCIYMFKQFYLSRYNGRRIYFPLVLGTTLFHLNHQGKTCEIVAPALYTGIMEALNQDGEIEINTITRESSLSAEDVETLLNVLAQHNLVVCSGSCFRFNVAFHPRRNRVSILHAIQGNASCSRNAPGKGRNVKPPRHTIIEATIIYIMKRKKHAEHAPLFEEVKEALKHVFVLSTADMKYCTESLITRGFLTRGDRSGLYMFEE